MATQPTNGRRAFIANTVKGTLAVSIGMSTAAPLLMSCASSKNIAGASSLKTGFDQLPLPYNYNALENVIDAMTMEIHYSKHAAAYAKNLKEAAAAEAVDMKKPLENVLANMSKYSAKMRNNGGGHWNHSLFWQVMAPAGKGGGGAPSGDLAKAIDAAYGSFDKFKETFANAAATRFGSGWAWLCVHKGGKVEVCSTANQDNPLMKSAIGDAAGCGGQPILGLDVWEHAYYLNYQNKRPDYVSAWWNVVNWGKVAELFAKSK